MAGAVKHMQRSHRSYRNNMNNGIFTQFHRNAYSVKQYKESRMTLGKRLSNLFRKMLPNTSSK